MNLLTSTDLAFQLNDGKFEYNKRCGYVALGQIFFSLQYMKYYLTITLFALNFYEVIADSAKGN